MYWDEDVTLKFVRIYLKQEHECLWNPLHPDNKILFRRKKAHENIISEFKAATSITLSLDKVKKKILSLRVAYTTQVNKILHKSTTEPECTYEPNLQWFYEMERCLKTVLGRQHGIYTEKPTEVGSSHQSMSSELQSRNSKEINPEPLILQADAEYINIAKGESEINIKNHQSPLENLTTQSQQSSSTKSIMKEDEFDIYGKFIASQLKKNNLEKAVRLQLQIQNIVCEARLSDLHTS